MFYFFSNSIGSLKLGHPIYVISLQQSALMARSVIKHNNNIHLSLIVVVTILVADTDVG